jgi:hypothetical protein
MNASVFSYTVVVSGSTVAKFSKWGVETMLYHSGVSVCIRCHALLQEEDRQNIRGVPASDPISQRIMGR